MRFTFAGEDLVYDPKHLNLADARLLKAQFGLTVRGYLDGLAEADPDALAALYWLSHKQAGIPCDPAQLPDFDLLAFSNAFGDAEESADAGPASDAAAGAGTQIGHPAPEPAVEEQPAG